MDFQNIIARALEVREKYSLLEKKRGKEWTKLNIMEGFVGDVGDLMKLIMAKEGLRDVENIDDKLAHELSDCLWCILVLSHKYNINIEDQFLLNMNALEKKLSQTI